MDIAGRNDYANDVAVTPKGRVVLAGQTEVEELGPGRHLHPSRRRAQARRHEGRRVAKRGVSRPAFGGVRATIYQIARRADGLCCWPESQSPPVPELAVIDRAAAKALHRGLAVPWPYAVPDAGDAS